MNLPAAGSTQAVLTVAVLAAAVLHAVWNALAHAMRDRFVGFVVMAAAYAVCSAAMLPLVAAPAPASRPLLAVSAGLHVVYNLLLIRSYRGAEFNRVYPLARGVSPLVVAVVAAGLLGERLSPVQLAGVGVVSAGLGTLVLSGRRGDGRGWGGGVVAATGTGLAIAAYTVVDGVGVRRSGSVLGYSGWLFLLQGSVNVLVGFLLRGRSLLRQARPAAPVGLACGVLSLLAYDLVLAAQTRGALAAVAALRETSVIVGALIGAIVFHEPFGRARLIAAAAVTAGIVLLNLSG